MNDCAIQIKTPVYIELNAKDVYVEDENKDFEHISYSKAKTLLKSVETTVRYTSSGSEAACNFMNSLSRKRFFITENNIYPKIPISNFMGGKGTLQ